MLNFDSGSGLVEVEAGMQWPKLIQTCMSMQRGAAQQWGIVQKQTGADRLSIGGALSANIHGRGLTLKPLVGDIESFKLVTADGRVLTCSRSQNAELFKLTIGGYGLFGVVSSVTLRLMPRRKLRRVVEIVRIDDVMTRFEERIREGFLFGDCQFAIDPASDDFLHRGISPAIARSILRPRFLMAKGKLPRKNGYACFISLTPIRRERLMCMRMNIAPLMGRSIGLTRIS